MYVGVQVLVVSRWTLVKAVGGAELSASSMWGSMGESCMVLSMLKLETEVGYTIKSAPNYLLFKT